MLNDLFISKAYYNNYLTQNNMASTSETGHAKNVANFQDLIEFVTGYGATYNPSKNALKLSELTSLKTLATANLDDVIAKNTVFNSRVNERVIAFSDLKALSTRLINALQTTDATQQTIKDAKVFNRKMQGKSASSAPPPKDPNAPVPNTISTSQQSYDQLIQHLAGLTAILDSEPSYTPNETDLKVTTLLAKQTELTNKNTAVASSYANVSNSRITRNNTLYNDTNGLVEIALEVKKYIKSVFGASSPEFAQVKSIEFKKPRVLV